MQKGSDGLPYLSVSYANGPGAADHQGVNGARRDLTNEPKAIYGKYSLIDSKNLLEISLTNLKLYTVL